MSRVREIVSRETGRDVSDADRLDELGLDSLETTELILTIEKETGVELGRYSEAETVGELEKEFSR